MNNKQRVFIVARKRGWTVQQVWDLLSYSLMPQTHKQRPVKWLVDPSGYQNMTGRYFPRLYHYDYRDLTKEQADSLVAYIVSNTCPR